MGSILPPIDAPSVISSGRTTAIPEATSLKQLLQHILHCLLFVVKLPRCPPRETQVPEVLHPLVRPLAPLELRYLPTKAPPERTKLSACEVPGVYTPLFSQNSLSPLVVRASLNCSRLSASAHVSPLPPGTSGVTRGRSWLQQERRRAREQA